MITEEGKITFNQEGKPLYEYFLKDHLGNTRAVIDQEGHLAQTSSYYPFGMQTEALCYTSTTHQQNNYLYNGKELQDDFGLGWYDYGARYYDAELARFHSADPLAGDFPSWTPYHYVHNNPLNMIDPTGMSADWVEGVDGEIKWDNNATSQETTKEGETYLGENVIVEEGALADKDGNVDEEINEATFSLYTPANKERPTATMKGNTVSADGDKYATIAAGTMDGEKTKYKNTPAILINGGGKVPTTKENPNPESNYSGQKYADRIYIHAGNKNYKRLTTSKGKAISEGCQTGSNGDRAPYTKFMEKVPENTKIKIVLKRNK